MQTTDRLVSKYIWIELPYLEQTIRGYRQDDKYYHTISHSVKTLSENPRIQSHKMAPTTLKAAVRSTYICINIF